MNPSVPSRGGDIGQGLAREFAELARALQAESGRLGTLQTVCELAVKVLDADHSSITIRRNGTVQTVAATSDVPGLVDRIQQETGEGPVVESERDGVLVCNDLAEDDRWPAFNARAVAEARVRSVLASRLFVRDGTLATLNVYAALPQAFDERDVVITGVFAAHAAVAVQAAEEQERADNLELALRSSRRIGTAIGILMHQHRVGEQEAFDLLRQRSQHSNRKLADIAEEVVYTGSL